MKDLKVWELLKNDQMIVWCRRWRVTARVIDYEKFLWCIVVLPQCTIKMLSLYSPIFYDDVVSRITFSLRGNVKYCNFKGYSKCISLMYPKGDAIIPLAGCYYCILVTIELSGKSSIVIQVISTLINNIIYFFESYSVKSTQKIQWGRLD